LSLLSVARWSRLLIVVWALTGLACSTPRESQAPVPKASSAAAPTPRPRPSVERTGAIEISTDVAGAIVTVDGEARGPAPQRIIGLSPGKHQVRIEAPDREPWEGSVTVFPDVAVPLKARLLPQRVSLHVECDVPGASVFIDRRFIGKSPVAVADLSLGTHVLSVSSEGYDIHTETLRLKPGRTNVRVALKAVRLNETLEVIHKHGFGSCRGRLSASPEGVAFASTDPRHSFKVPLADIKEIHAEYLRKNLQIRLSDGRKFNFTTDDDNADALITFEQKVSKACGLARQEAH